MYIVYVYAVDIMILPVYIYFIYVVNIMILPVYICIVCVFIVDSTPMTFTAFLLVSNVKTGVVVQ